MTWTLGIFQYIGPNGTVGASWQDPDDTSINCFSLPHWVGLAKKFDEAGLDFLFFADSYGYPLHEGEPAAAAVSEGRGFPQADPVPLISALAAVTERLGFVVTASTTVEAPAANARRFATLDHFTSGRIGWNVVTGSSAVPAAALMGKELIAHDTRYDMADDYLELSLKLWEGSWEDDALLLDRQKGIYADPAKVHLIHHEGPWFRCDGLLNVPPSPQRTPVLVQAGSSGRGKNFAGRNAEVVFLGGGKPEKVAANVADIRAAAVAEGRPADAVKVLVGAMFIAAPTSQEAWALHAKMLGYSSIEGAAAIYEGNTGIDLLSLDPALPLTQTRTDQGQGNVDRYAPGPGGSGPTVGEILENFRVTGINGSIFVGSAEEVADQAEEFIAATGADGFLIQPNVTPITYDHLIDLVLPVLRERGLIGAGPAPVTLRENLFGAGPHLPEHHPGAAHRIG